MVSRQEEGAPPTRRWKFSAHAPVTNGKALQDVLWSAGRAYNQVLEIAREGQIKKWRITENHVPGLLQTKERLQELTEDLARARQDVEDWRQSEYQRTGKKSRATPPEMKEKISTLKEKRKECWAEEKELRTKFHERIEPWREREKDLLDEFKKGVHKSDWRKRQAANDKAFEMIVAECNDVAYLELRRAEIETRTAITAQSNVKACAELSRTMFNDVDKRVQTALKKTKFGLPRFQRNEGTGEVIVELKVNTAKGRRWTWAEIWRPNTQAWLRDDTWSDTQRKNRRKGRRRYAMLTLRVGSKGTRREPIFAEIPIMLHNEPPSDAEVKNVVLVVTRIGRERRYEAQFVVQHPSFAEAKRPRGSGTVRVTYGWEKRDNGIRVATAKGDDGWEDELVLPFEKSKRRHGCIETIQFADSLKMVSKRIDNKMTGHVARRKEVKHEERQWGRVLKHLLAAQGSHLTYLDRAVRSDANHERFERYVEKWCNTVLGERLSIVWAAWVAERKSMRDKRAQDLHQSVSVVGTWCNAHGLRPGVEHLAFWMWCWLQKTRHMHKLERYEARRGRNMRKELVRMWAIRLATRYEFLERNKQKLAAAAKRRKVEDDNSSPTEAQLHADAVRLQRWLASPGEARSIICQVFGGTPEKPKKPICGDRIVDPPEEKSTSDAPEGQMPHPRHLVNAAE